MARASWNGEVLAESDQPIVVENNHYFPPDSVHREFFRPSQHTSVCGWKGTASYYDLVVNGATNPNAAWFYTHPLPAAANIAGYLAFWKGVHVES